MTSTELIDNPSYNKEFSVKIKLDDCVDSQIESIIIKLKEMNWGFASQLAKIIENDKS